MREALQPHIGQRIQITAPVQRLGTRIGWTGARLPTLLVGPVLDSQGAELTDHLWLHVGRRIAAVAPQPGDVLTLTARVQPYTRRRRQYHGTEVRLESDLGLAYPARCAAVARAEAPDHVSHGTDEEAQEISPMGESENVRLTAQVMPKADVSHRIRTAPIPVPARARLLFALAVLSLEEPGPISLTKLNARAGVPPIAFLAQIKKLGSAGIVQFTPSGRILLTTQPTVAQRGIAL